MKRVKISATALTDIGQARETNQDHALAWASNPRDGVARGVLLVADGMGGHRDGEVASKIAVETARDVLVPWLEAFEGEFEVDPFAQHIAEAYDAANKAIFEYSVKAGIRNGNIGTTLECAILHQEHAILGHIGDSRAYILRPQGLMQLTVDHSAVGELVEAGILEPDDRYTHPNRNILTRGLGDGSPPELDVVDLKLRVGERILLCSDGLWGMVRDLELEKVLLKADAPEDLARELVAMANHNGGDDNISAAIAELLPG
jgi:serine/threonine protein phosphatase PrpC